jgi:hypothetical protein
VLTVAGVTSSAATNHMRSQEIVFQRFVSNYGGYWSSLNTEVQQRREKKDQQFAKLQAGFVQRFSIFRQGEKQAVVRHQDGATASS